MSAIARSPLSGTAEYLFAGFVGLAIVTIVTPLRTLHALLTWWMVALLPLTTFQDLFLIAFFAWIFHGLFAIAKRPWARNTVAVAGWAVCLGLALYTYLSDIIYLVIRRPLTAGLLVAADNLRGIQSSIDAVVTPRLVAALAMAPLYTLLIAWVLARWAPKTLRRLSNGFHSVAGLVCSVTFLITAKVWAVHYVPYSLESFNPQWTFVSSVFESHTPAVTDPIPSSYLDDFRPVGHPHAATAEPLPVTGMAAAVSDKPIDVVMVILESVGAPRVHLYGAPFNDTPNLDELARHAAVFSQVYAAEAETSAAMAALLSSVYPDHDWPSITQIAPSLAIPGLPAVLSSHGYRTVFLRSGELVFDREGEFLNTRGFDKIFGEPRDYDFPRELQMLPKVKKWIKADPSRPFFVVIWTHNTHHPYVTRFHHNYGVGDPSLNRYLNGVYEADDFIKRLVAMLQKMGLADRTLLIVTGDHGEAFGEHGELIHGGSVYNEMVHVPLMIENPKIFPHEIVVDRLMRQIDIAPTLLALLGFNPPTTWQGTDVFGTNPPERAYLFAGTGNFTFGLVEGNFKYIYNFRRGQTQLYNLVTDPGEKNNLASNSAYAKMIKRDHLRVEAWVSFQNRYLAQFENPEHATTTGPSGH